MFQGPCGARVYILTHFIYFSLLDAVLKFVQKASSAPNDLKMTMSDDISDAHKIPSNVTPWHTDDTEHH